MLRHPGQRVTMGRPRNRKSYFTDDSSEGPCSHFRDGQNEWFPIVPEGGGSELGTEFLMCRFCCL